MCQHHGRVNAVEFPEVSSLILIGDLHGDMGILKDFIPQEGDMIIQVGDFFIPDNWIPPAYPIFFIDGNHEKDLPKLVSLTEVTEVRENLFYIPRGTVLEIGGKRVGFLGGGSSLDRYQRTEGVSWFPEEIPTEAQCASLCNKGPLDLLVTHSPPANVLNLALPPLDRSSFGLPAGWKDEAAEKIQDVWDTLGRPQLICGHAHTAFSGPNFRILDIDEMYFMILERLR